MSEFWHVDGAEAITGTTGAPIGAYTVAPNIRPRVGQPDPLSRHGTGYYYNTTTETAVGVLPGMLSLTFAAAGYQDAVIRIRMNMSQSGDHYAYIRGISGGAIESGYGTGLGNNNVNIGTWTAGEWWHGEISMYLDPLSVGGNGSYFMKFYVNGQLMRTTSFDSSGIELNDVENFISVQFVGSVDDIVAYGSTAATYRDQLGDLRVETLVPTATANLRTADGDTTYVTLSPGDVIDYAVDSPVGSLAGGIKAVIGEVIGRKENASDATYLSAFPVIDGVEYGTGYVRAASTGYRPYAAGIKGAPVVDPGDLVVRVRVNT